MEDPRLFEIKNFKLLRDFVIEIHFKTGKIQVIDFNEVHQPGWWAELTDLDYFNQVSLDIINNLSWPNGQDFKPEHLYYWGKYRKYYLKSNADEVK